MIKWLTIAVMILAASPSYGAATFIEYCNNPPESFQRSLKIMLHNAGRMNKRPATCAEMDDYIRVSKSISLGGQSDLTLLRYFPELKTLRLRGLDALDLHDIQHLTQLESLHIEKEDLSNIAILANFIHLKSLHIESKVLSDISPLVKLERLWLRSDALVDISPLAPLVNLRYASIGRAVKALPTFKEMTKIKELNIGNNKLINIANIRYLTSLEKLDVAQNENLVNIASLQFLPNLKELNIISTGVSDLSALRLTSGLTYIALYGTKVKDLSSLVAHKNLRRVSVTDFGLKSCSPHDLEEIKLGISCDNGWWSNFTKRYF